MLSSGIICPSSSPWASPVVIVRKKDGGMRFCINFWQLNAAIIKDGHPLPLTDDLLDALHGACWFSKEEDKYKATFTNSNGQLYELNQVLIGVCNASVTFYRFMDHVLSGLNWETRLFYLDNIIVLSKSWYEHLQCLEVVFECLCQTKLKLRVEKCTLATPEVPQGCKGQSVA